MPGVDRLGLDCLVDAIGAAGEQGIGAVALFPYTAQELKTPDAREAVNPGNLVCRAVRAVKHALPDIGIVCDVALDPYISDGYDGLLRDGRILNDRSEEHTSELQSLMRISYAGFCLKKKKKKLTHT